MGHLAIVNEVSFNDVLQTGYISTGGKLGQQMVRTISDLLADALAVRRDDFIFPWMTGGTRGTCGFQHVFKAAGTPVFMKGQLFPIKIPIQREGKKFGRFLPEYEAVDLWDSKLLWNAIGKKSIGRGRSITHQTPMEDIKLKEMMETKAFDKNMPVESVNVIMNDSVRGVPISIDASRDKWDNKLKELLDKTDENKRLSCLDLNGVPWRNGDRFQTEKTLEAWLMENIDKDSCGQLRDILLKDGEKIDWFGNNLPFGVQGSAMDMIIVHSTREKMRCTVIELKVKGESEIELDKDVLQVSGYQKFIRSAFAHYNQNVEVLPVILTGKNKSVIYKKCPRLVQYEISTSGKVSFMEMK